MKLRKSYTPEQRTKILAKVNERVAKGETTTAACKAEGIFDSMYYHWKSGNRGFKNAKPAATVIVHEATALAKQRKPYTKKSQTLAPSTDFVMIVRLDQLKNVMGMLQ